MSQAFTYQLVQGIWNPREAGFSWVVADEFPDLKSARAALNEIVAKAAGVSAKRNSPAHRLAYNAAPHAIVEIKSKIIERIGASVDETVALSQDS